MKSHEKHSSDPPYADEMNSKILVTEGMLELATNTSGVFRILLDELGVEISSVLTMRFSLLFLTGAIGCV